MAATFGLGVLVLLLLIALAVPIGFALGLGGVLSLGMLVPTGTIEALMSKVVRDTSASYVFLTIPMFVLMAEFLSVGRVAEDLFLSCNRVLRKIRGGMAMAVIVAGAIHAAVTGSSTASAASLSRASYPAMRRAGYDPGFAVGTAAIAGTLAVMIPPSTAFILYSLMTDTSVGKLFIAGIIPGAITAVGYIVTISLVLKYRPHLGPKPGAEVEAAKHRTSGRVWPVVLLIAVVVGALYAGIATPTEVAAIGAAGALLVSLSTKRMTRHGFLDAVGTTLRITTMIITIIFGAHLFGYFISFSQITTMMLQWIADSGISPTMVMLLVVFVYLLLGMVMDQAAIIILTAPISTALMVGLGYDPIWWGVIIIKTAEIGLVSPPLGLVTFVVSATSKVDLRRSFIGVLPYLVMEIIILTLLLAFPQLSLVLTG
ncbi:TRAP transporter large permease [Paracoccus denitrificans]|jgi:tripartite ATP-independent transporter DctM subunit|uniref:TRAP transporter large permease protein n=1 Tax=Paracoccus denitrificans (strain Pd 1222) TaxID=318586 RepID=A1B6Z4_PARDP|nr:TRAP transporter large permease [Paracoccus denitrificans]ABL71288.1 TRAP dicarboxylate transporter, DctM subunit [Paracoccus denitrificans PD1222]MBB4629581.1 tripartite ATP-independent transporter DctM subunit [Paracoccus denitrificans]MCU7430977.1 TRAP transporter large permease [Paracoccus denitrificans]QAR27918.1 TRAP transporter large permease [Paracoccus denitrificans]UPV97632.1 TRAP transporter large permease [Paracoccus denitrificans]